jgi:hypothetical protein
MDKVCYWDEVEGCQKERDCTPDEQAEIDARRAAGPTPESINAPILAALTLIDAKTPRAVREAIQTGDNSRVLALEADAATLRAQLVKV